MNEPTPPPSPLNGSCVLLGISGGIAAYKSAELCRELIKVGASVRVIMTDAATEFVAPLTFETLTGHPVYVKMFDRERAWEIEHISWAQWGDALLIAPATANVLAKMAAGLADDALSTTALAFRGPTIVAPAMNTAMWEHPQTRENLTKLRERGVAVVQPGSGDLACGDQGEGRLANVDAICEATEGTLGRKDRTGDLAGKSVLITAGPTVEPLDPVRHLSNPSSGRMGFALAAEARRRGAQVTVVCGPTHVEPPARLAEVVRTQTAHEMRDAVMARFDAQDICIFTAAVADYTPESPSAEKMKKDRTGDTITLRLVRTPDIAAQAGAARRPGQTLVLFAAETENLIANAKAKMEAKGFDCIVANEISEANPAFAVSENTVVLLARSGAERRLPRASKESLAGPIWDFVLEPHPEA